MVVCWAWRCLWWRICKHSFPTIWIYHGLKMQCLKWPFIPHCMDLSWFQQCNVCDCAHVSIFPQMVTHILQMRTVCYMPLLCSPNPVMFWIFFFCGGGFAWKLYQIHCPMSVLGHLMEWVDQTECRDHLISCVKKSIQHICHPNHHSGNQIQWIGINWFFPNHSCTIFGSIAGWNRFTWTQLEWTLLPN